MTLNSLKEPSTTRLCGEKTIFSRSEARKIALPYALVKQAEKDFQLNSAETVRRQLSPKPAAVKALSDYFTSAYGQRDLSRLAPGGISFSRRIIWW